MNELSFSYYDTSYIDKFKECTIDQNLNKYEETTDYSKYKTNITKINKQKIVVKYKQAMNNPFLSSQTNNEEIMKLFEFNFKHKWINVSNYWFVKLYDNSNVITFFYYEYIF